MSHHCHAAGCDKRVPPAMFACLRHWSALPSNVKRAIWLRYRPGQERDKKPSPPYMAVQRYAVAWLARRDGLERESEAAVFDAVMWEARCREGALGEPLAGLDRFWEKTDGG